MDKKKKTYKQAMAELESIIEKIESQPPDIDELSDLVKKAVNLVNYCKSKLRETEQELNKSMDQLE